MSQNIDHPKANRRSPGIALGSYLFLALILWTSAICGSLWFSVSTAKDYAQTAARIQARTAFEKDVIYRRWNSGLGGVYVPITEKTPPNPYLEDPNKTFVSSFNVTMTKINPAYMTRLVHEIGELKSGVRGHITSNTPIRPANQPDPWESAALKQLENFEVEEVNSVEMIDGKPFLRLMGPLITEKGCLNCHAFQGYKLGDIRGGISISVPMAPFLAQARTTIATLTYSHVALWLLGVLAIAFSSYRLKLRIRERDQAEHDLLKLTEELEQRVTERTESLRQRQREIQAFMQNTEAGVYLKNRQHEYILVNRRYCLLTNKTVENLLGQQDEKFFSPVMVQRIKAVEENVLNSGISEEVDNFFAAEDGETIHNGFIFPIMEDDSGVIEGLGCIVVDVTQKRQMAEAMIRAKEEAESANRAKSDFLANMSHEIRTPLNGILGMADILLRSSLESDHASMVSTIKNSGDGLLTVLNDILDFSKIEAGKMHLEKLPFSLKDLVFNASRGLASLAFGKNVEFIVHLDPDIPDRVVGDEVRLRQIILNLAGNAIKFTAHGEVAVKLDFISKNDTEVCFKISVSDTGIGIPEDKQGKIFDAFEQSDTSTTRKYGGTGLGLPICRRLAEFMNSDLKVASHAGQGSIFYFELTLPLAGDEEIPPPKQLLLELAAYRILVVDDNATNRHIFQELLNRWGLKGRFCQSADEALEAIKEGLDKEEPFHLVLTDLQMPDKNGLELIRDIRSQKLDLPIILLSSGNFEPEEDENRPQAHLEKPVRPDDLLTTIGRTLGIWKKSGKKVRKTNETEPSLAPLHILLTEDVDVNQKVATRMLTQLGHTVVIADNGEVALKILENEKFDLILMDIQMPIMDGVTATHHIREREKAGTPFSPIVAMTANAMKGDRENYLESGMDSYISKPIRFTELADMLNEMIRTFNLGGYTPPESDT